MSSFESSAPDSPDAAVQVPRSPGWHHSKYHARFRAGLKESLASLAAPYQSGSNWDRVREGSISFPRARSGRGIKGPRSLVSMCLRVLADNIGACTESMISAVPEKLQWALWKELLPRTMSFHAWNLLAYELMGNIICHADDIIHYQRNQENEDVTIPMAMYRYCQEIIDPPCELRVYINPLECTRSLIYLCIDNVTRFENNELLALAQLDQLVVLELIEREPTSNCISDRLIRGWTEMKRSLATAPLPFYKLRVLKITSGTHAVSEGSLRCVLNFPKLEIFDITALPVQRWRNARDIAAEYGWKATEPEGSVFVSYANAYLDGSVAVHPSAVNGLRTAFEDDRLQLLVVDDPRRVIGKEHYDAYLAEQKRRRNAYWARNAYWGSEMDDDDEAPPPDLSTYLEDGWRALLQGDRPLSTTDDTQGSGDIQQQPGMSDDQVFWFLSLLDQKQYITENTTQAHVAGVTVLRDQLVSLRLRNPSNASEQNRRLLSSQRLIFSRHRKKATAAEAGQDRAPEPSRAPRPDDRTETTRAEAGLDRTPEPSWAPRPEDRKEATVAEARHHHTSEPSWAPRPDDRRERNLKPRKRQKVGDMFASFGM